MDPARHRGRGLVSAGRPFLLVNPRSGSGSPSAEELAAEAGRLGIETDELAPGRDAAELARAAADRGSPALGVAGGDGSLGAVADVALERDLPFACVPFGTRNHFARDLGLDPDDPLAALPALAGGEERRVDAGTVNGRTFLNNVSLGIYASFVHDPARKTRNRLLAFLRMVPAALGRSRRPLALDFEVDGRPEQRLALVALVASNDYGGGSLGELGSRERLDEGLLHVYVIEAVGRRALLGLLARAAQGRAEEAEGLVEWACERLEIESNRPRVHAAVDGEPVVLEPPLALEIRPRGLRVLLPA
ncbi:MAG TPA: diacylglycerol kinase family protein [Gaiellaceae bacterium]|nr:diacylglycerol kinase family protein [Gaiellaceae bacterium]